MAFTYDLSTDVGRVRMLVPDRVQADAIFSDEEITAFLEMEGGVVKGAAALALETIASDQALVLKVIRLMDLSTDGAKVSQALLERAARLRAQVEDEEELEAEDLFDVADMVLDVFSAREHLRNEALRDG